MKKEVWTTCGFCNKDIFEPASFCPNCDANIDRQIVETTVKSTSKNKLAKTLTKNEYIRKLVNSYGGELRGLGDVVCDAPKCKDRTNELQFIFTADDGGKLTSLTFLCKDHFREWIREHSLLKHKQFYIDNNIDFEEFEYSDEDLDRIDKENKR